MNGSFDVFVCVNPPAPATVWVDDNWVGLPNGTDVGSSRTIGCDAFATIQGGVNAVAAGGTVNVAAGNYNEDVIVNKVVHDPRRGRGLVRSSAVRSAAAARRSRCASSNVDARPASRSPATATTRPIGTTRPELGRRPIQGLALTGIVIRDNLITGNRTGIDINNSSGHTVRNNVIDDNRTGLIFRNQTDNMLGRRERDHEQLDRRRPVPRRQRRHRTSRCRRR